VQRILIIDSPVALGDADKRAFDEQHGLAAMCGLLRHAIAENVLASLPIEAMSHFLLAGTREAAVYVATANNPHQAKEHAITTVKRILAGLTTTE
jgi:hypothetical protein